jgi:uncharacterized protein YecA (UPF0149 family)
MNDLVQETSRQLAKFTNKLPILGRKPFKRKRPLPGRNDKCPCGSGKKFKHCCEKKFRCSCSMML